MSWVIIVQDLPKSAKSVQEIPDNFEPQPLAARAAIIEKILSIHPDVDFSDPAWGVLDRESEGYTVEFNMGEEEIVESFAMHVRGGDKAVNAVAAVLSALGLRALDTVSGDFFDLNTAFRSLKSFNEYLEQVLGK